MACGYPLGWVTGLGECITTQATDTLSCYSSISFLPIICSVRSVYSFFVPPEEKQLQMTGRQWRYGLVMMPHMLAGVGGPAEGRPARHADAAPAQVAAASHQSTGDTDELDDGHGPDGAVLEPADEVLPDPVVPDVTTSTRYRQVYGNIPLHRAVLDVFCRMAVLGGRLMGDNVADTTRMTEQQMRDLADEACDLIINRVDLLFGPMHTSKAYRLANHLLVALLRNGNLWEGDTSENESLHGPCKRMYSRTNKRGPTIVLQMMRASETQNEVLRELKDLEDETMEEDGGLFDLLDGNVDEGDVPTESVHLLPRSDRGQRLTVSDVQALPGMGAFGELLDKNPDCSLVVTSSFSFYCTFEWGAPSVVQTACASDSYLGKPRYDYIWYTDMDGQRALGWVRLVVRMLGGAQDDFAVVRRLEPVAPIAQCALSRSGCRRMAWRFDTPADDWPLLHCVPLCQVLRIEHVVPDFEDLCDRHGLRAVPSNTPDTAAERHAQRFFTNSFYPFTSRVLNPSS